MAPFVTLALSAAVIWGSIGAVVGGLLAALSPLYVISTVVGRAASGGAARRVCRRFERWMKLSTLGGPLLIVSTVALMVGNPILATYAAQRLGILYGGALMLVAAPSYTFAAFFLLSYGVRFGVVRPGPGSGGDAPPDIVLTFAAGIAPSFAITYGAFVVGSLAARDVWETMPFLMLVSNVLFDGLTLVATFALIGWAMRGKRRTGVPLRRIFAAVVADVVIAAILACCSLYIGLRFTDGPVTVAETLNILRARSASGDAWELVLGHVIGWGNVSQGRSWRLPA